MEKVVNKIQKKSALIGANYRYERKFITNYNHIEDLVQKLYSHSFNFSEVFFKRRVNNVYYDDNKLDFYKQNVSGVGKREKFRLRWYGNDFSSINDPVFEVKLKFGQVGDKVSYKIKNFNLDLSIISMHDFYTIISDKVKDSNILIQSKFFQLYPTLYNSYDRRYFLSACEKFRITLDYNQHFYNPNYKNFQLSKYKIDIDEIIVELKYQTQFDEEARDVSQEFNFRLSKNSKYVRGIELIY